MVGIIRKLIGQRSRQLISGQEKPGPKLAFLKNMPAFIKEFNEKTKGNMGNVVTTKIFLYSDGSYKYQIMFTPVPLLIKKIVNDKKEITQEQFSDLVKQVISSDILNTTNVISAEKIILGTLKSMKINLHS